MLKILDSKVTKNKSGNPVSWKLTQCACGDIKWRDAKSAVRVRMCDACHKASQARMSASYSNHPLHAIWYGMYSRCHIATSKAYKNYGGRGLSVCEEWRFLGDKNDRQRFLKFVSDMGPVPVGGTLERVDNNNGYCKSNCVWAPFTVQANNRRNNRILTSAISGMSKTVSQWAAHLGVLRKVVAYPVTYFNLDIDTIASRIQNSNGGVVWKERASKRIMCDLGRGSVSVRDICAKLCVNEGNALGYIKRGHTPELSVVMAWLGKKAREEGRYNLVFVKEEAENFLKRRGIGV